MGLFVPIRKPEPCHRRKEGGILRFDDRQRQAIHKEHGVRPDVFRAEDAELVDHQKLVILGIVPIHKPDRGGGHSGGLVFQAEVVREGVMDG